MPCKTLYRIDDLSDHGSDSGACHAPAKVLPGEAKVIISSMSPDTYKYDKVTLEFQVQT